MLLLQSWLKPGVAQISCEAKAGIPGVVFRAAENPPRAGNCDGGGEMDGCGYGHHVPAAWIQLVVGCGLFADSVVDDVW